MSTKVLVPIKRVVDYAVKIRIKSDKSGMFRNRLPLDVRSLSNLSINSTVF
jgi:electron transfer flavoprotein beta subunit